jgi:biofilm PGA synthesis N-glycosyltransferase PgaC
MILTFWISFFVLFYTYIGYGVLVFLINAFKGLFITNKPPAAKTEFPVTIIVSAYNEANVLDQKIKNTQGLDYPSKLLKIIFVTDGSSDASAELLKRYPDIMVLHQQVRKGKAAAINRAMKNVTTPIVIFSDANTMLNPDCIHKIVKHYNDPRIGGVAGEKKIIRHKRLSAVGEAEGLYWQYESLLKKLDSKFNTVIGAAGELFSIRTRLFHALHENLILDDFAISMNIGLKGYKIKYEPQAYAAEFPSNSLREEEKRKVRIAAGSYQFMSLGKSSLNFFKHPLLTFQYFSRKILRWVFCPLLLLLILFLDVFIVINLESSVYYLCFLYLQLLFYFLAMAGWLLILSGRKAGLLNIPFYFVFMNYCLVKGFFKYVNGKQSVLWEKSLRQAVEN